MKKWPVVYKHGTNITEYHTRQIRPRNSSSDEEIDSIWDDRCLTARQIVKYIGISSGSLHAVLIENLEMKKMSARLFLTMLTPEQKG